MLPSTVWVVDDDEDDQLFIRAAFEKGTPPITVFGLTDGVELLPKLASCSKLPRLILLDINMPLKNGFETLRDLRAIPAYATLPVVMLTTSSHGDDRNRAFALGANHFLTKPLSQEQLQAMATALTSQWLLAD